MGGYSTQHEDPSQHDRPSWSTVGDRHIHDNIQWRDQFAVMEERAVLSSIVLGMPGLPEPFMRAWNSGYCAWEMSERLGDWHGDGLAELAASLDRLYWLEHPTEAPPARVTSRNVRAHHFDELWSWFVTEGYLTFDGTPDEYAAHKAHARMRYLKDSGA